MEIGKILRHYRKVNGYSQKELAGLVFVSEGAIRHIESGRNSPSVEMLQLLAEALQIKVTDFFQPHNSESRQLDESPENDTIPVKNKYDIIQNLFGSYTKRTEKKKPVVKINPNMDARAFKAKVRKLYESPDFQVEFAENTKNIRATNVGCFYDKSLAKQLINLSQNESTYFDEIWEYSPDFWIISGKFEGKQFTLYFKHKVDGKCEMDANVYYTPKRRKGETFEGAKWIKPVLDIVYPFFEQKYQFQNIKLNPFALTYFENSRKSDLLTMKWKDFHDFEPRAHNALTKEKKFTVGDVMKMTKNEILSIETIGSASAYEIEFFQKKLEPILSILKED